MLCQKLIDHKISPRPRSPLKQVFLACYNSDPQASADAAFLVFGETTWCCPVTVICLLLSALPRMDGVLVNITYQMMILLCGFVVCFFVCFLSRRIKKKSKAHILVCLKKFCSPIEVIVQQMIVFLCLRVKPWYRHPVNQSRTVNFLSCTLFSMVEMSASLPLFSVSFFPHIFDYKNILSFTPSLSLSSNMPVPHSYGKTLLSASFSFMLSKQRT